MNPDGSFAENWVDALEDDLKGNEALKNYKSLSGAMRSLLHAQQMVGADKVPLPKPNASQKELEDFARKIGWPGTEDGYKFDKEAVSGLDESAVNGFRKYCNENRIPAQYADAAVKFYSQYTKETLGRIGEQTEEQRAAGFDSLRKEWRGNYDSNFSEASAAVRSLGLAEKLIERGLDSDPDMVRMFYEVSRSMRPDVLIKGGASSAKAQDAQSQIDAITKNPSSEEYKRWMNGDPIIVAKVNRLYEML